MRAPGPPYPDLTHSQRQIWIGQKRSPASPLYNMAFAFRFGVQLRSDFFAQAWQRVVDASDALRTRVVERDGVARCELHPPGSCPLEILDLRGDESSEAEFLQRCRERCRRPLPLDGPLVDSVLVALDGGRTGWYLNQHHLVADARSTILLYRLVATQYQSLCAGGSAAVELEPYDSTVSHLSVAPAARAASAAHWAARADGRARAVPFYGRHLEASGTASTRHTLVLQEEHSQRLAALAGQAGWRSLSFELSYFAVLATVVAAWLHRLGGGTRLGFDSPVHGRTTSSAGEALGLFIEMFPFAVEIEAGVTFRELGARCLEEAQLFLRHALPGASAPSNATASNVVLNYYPDSFPDFAGHRAAVDWVHPGHADSVHALRLQVHDFSGVGRTTLHFDCNDEMLPPSCQGRLQGHFERMLAAFLEDPDRPIAAVDILVDEDRRGSSALCGDCAAPLPEVTVVESFEARARAEPERVALRQGDREIRFGQLRRDVDALAATLAQGGGGAGARVAILGKRSTLSVTAILATLRARCAYVPIDPGQPPVRVRQILEDSGAAVALVGEGLELQDMTASVPSAVTLLSIADGIEAGRQLDPPTERPRLDDLAYLLYTSGSSGRPKGVLVEHGGLADYLRWASGQYVRGDRLAFALFTSLSFDLTVTSLFLPLLTGGRLEIYPEPEGAVDSAIFDVATANSVDCIKLTPSHLSLLRQLDLSSSRLRRMIVGGEDFKTHLARSTSAQFQDRVEIYNEYGPTEAVVGCTVHRYDPQADLGSSVPIGLPADHVVLEILNEAGAAVPVGVPGELWISRYGLARGYHGLDELTNERFPLRPGEDRVRHYRTGDLVRVNEAGVLEYLGRLDRQLKISGVRVEPGEIETEILTHPAVRACVVAARRERRRPESPEQLRYCVRCGLPSNYPRAQFDAEGLCSVCRSYDEIEQRAQAYFKTIEDLRELLDSSRHQHHGPYDCMMLLSGGKDSTYALCQLVEMGFSVLAFTLDNGYISEGAKDNMRRVTEQLGVPLELSTTPAMNAIFRDSLQRFSNVCHGCFKTIYTLSTRRARELGIPIIVTGLSRGQMFETRLTEQLFRDERFSPEQVDAAVLAARKVYHRVDDQVARSLDVRIFQDDRVFEEVLYVDFYRYCDVGLDEVLSYLRDKVPWVRPEDTGRSTNCLINDVGIYVHKQERNFHNYALPYSWDVRLGHKTRSQALAELHDEIDVEHVRRTLLEVGYDQNASEAGTRSQALAAFYVSDVDLSEVELRDHLSERLPPQLVPSSLRRLDAVPLSANGKVDEEALPWEDLGAETEEQHVAPRGPVEEMLAELWQRELGAERIGAQSSFFELGGTSLGAMEVMVRLCRELDIDLALESLFEHPTLRELAHLVEERILGEVESMSEQEQRELLEENDGR